MTTMNRSEQETVLRRMKNSLGDQPTEQRLSVWQQVAAFLRKVRVVGVAGAVAFTLAACGSGGDGSLSPEEVVTPTPGVSQSQTTEPGETTAPVEEQPVDNDTSFAIDAASVTVPQDVIDAYGAEAAANLVPDTLAVASLANELQELHHARDGEESGYWSVYREQVTPELNARIQESVAAYAAGDAEAGERLTGLQPYAERDGSLGTFNGEVFRVGEQGINVEITNAPTVTLSDHGRVSVDLPQTITAVSDTGKTLTFTKNQVLFMVPGESGRWLLDSYAPENITPVEVS